jgi:maltose O-acetyltransferase
MTERDKMLAGELYNPLEADLVRAREQTRESEQELRRGLLSGLFGAGGDTVWMQPPFYCDYGSNIYLGTRVFFNFNCIVLDVCAVRIETTLCSVRAYRS